MIFKQDTQRQCQFTGCVAPLSGTHCPPSPGSWGAHSQSWGYSGCDAEELPRRA